MASALQLEDFDENVENLKATVRKSFARIYAALKARELKTLSQLDSILIQCQNDKESTRNCVEDIRINFDNESTILENVSNFGAIDFERLNFDNHTFTLEAYHRPKECYTIIEDLKKHENGKDLEALEEAALKETARNDNCICYVDTSMDDVSTTFRNLGEDAAHCELCIKSGMETRDYPDTASQRNSKEHSFTNDEKTKLDPTDDWLNSIKSQTETEPPEVDVMEHSMINST